MAGNSVTLAPPAAHNPPATSQAPGAAPSPPLADCAEALGRLWTYLKSWVGPDGGLRGPVIHRCDLKRTFAIHDTPWTQGPVIRGLIQLYRTGGQPYWLRQAVALGDAQVARMRPDGSFRWAGHEDDRFSSLVHNALADRALIDLAQTLETLDPPRAQRYLQTAGQNLTQYLLGELWDDALGGMRMARPGPKRPGAHRFVVNMNSVAVDAMIACDRLGRTRHFQEAIEKIGPRILALQSGQGPWRGAFAYSNVQPDCHVCLYTALALTGLPGLSEVTGDPRYAQAARQAWDHIQALRDERTGLWHHMVDRGRLHRNPIFVAGAGMIANALLDVEDIADRRLDRQAVADRILAFAHPHGGIANFVGYDSRDNFRRRGTSRPCWEDALPTPNWNAQAFYFLSRISRAPDPDRLPPAESAGGATKRYIWFESPRGLALVGLAPARSLFAGLWVKQLPAGVSLSLIRLVQGFKRPIRAIRSFVKRCLR